MTACAIFRNFVRFNSQEENERNSGQHTFADVDVGSDAAAVDERLDDEQRTDADELGRSRKQATHRRLQRGLGQEEAAGAGQRGRSE